MPGNPEIPIIDPNELKPLMYHAGVSLQACQHFEYGVKTALHLIAVAKIGEISIREAEDIVEDRNKKTLGQLIKILNEKIKISDGWDNAIKEGLTARNNIIHRFLLENAEKVVDPKYRPGLVSEIKELRQKVMDGDKAVKEIIETLYSYLGIDYVKLNQGWQQEIQDLNKKSTKKYKTI